MGRGRIRKSLASMVGVSLAMAGGLSAQAAEGPVSVSATASLSNVHYAVTDLAPGDGVAPTVSFSSTGLLAASNAVMGSQPVPTASAPFSGPLPTGTLNIASPDGSASGQASSGGLSAALSFQVGAQGVITPNGSPVAVSPSGASVYSQSHSGSEGAWSAILQQTSGKGPFDPVDVPAMPPVTGPGDFVLSAHTSLTITGHLQASVNAPFGPDSPFIGAVDGSGLMPLAGVIANAFVSVARLQPLSDVSGHYASSGALDQALQSAYDFSTAGASAFYLPLTPNAVFGKPLPSQAQDFTLTFTNDTDAPLAGTLLLSADVRALLPAVPEPSTIWLMGLGLPCIAGLARARRRRQA